MDKPFKWIVELEPVIPIHWCKTTLMEKLDCGAHDHLQGPRRVPSSKAKALYKSSRAGIRLYTKHTKGNDRDLQRAAGYSGLSQQTRIGK